MYMKICSNINIFKQLKVQKITFDLNNFLDDWLWLSIWFEIKRFVKKVEPYVHTWSCHFIFGVCRTMPNLTKFGTRWKLNSARFGNVYSDNIPSRIRPSGCVYDDTASHGGFLWGLISQTHAVLVLLILHHRKVALNSGCIGKDGRQTTDEFLQQQIRVVETDPSITVRSAVVEVVNGALHIGLAAVRVTQSLVLAPNILNFLVAESVIKALPMALQINAEVAG